MTVHDGSCRFMMASSQLHVLVVDVVVVFVVVVFVVVIVVFVVVIFVDAVVVVFVVVVLHDGSLGFTWVQLWI